MTTTARVDRRRSFVSVLATAAALVALVGLLGVSGVPGPLRPPPAGAVELVYGPQLPYGLPAGTALAPSGPITVTQPGTVLDSLEISGCVRVLADDVTIIRSRITCDGAPAAVTQSGGAQGLNVIDSVIRGGAVDPAGAGVWSDQPYAVVRSEITNVTDGVFLGNWATLDSSWVHDLTERPGEHNDLVQVTGASNVFVRNNLLEHRRGQTAAIMVKSDLAPIDNVTIENNVIAGGGFSIYVMAGNALGGCCDAPTNVRVWNNVVRAGSYVWGAMVAQGPTIVLCNKLDTGEALTYVAAPDGSGAQVNGCPYAY